MEANDYRWIASKLRSWARRKTKSADKHAAKYPSHPLSAALREEADRAERYADDLEDLAREIE